MRFLPRYHRVASRDRCHRARPPLPPAYSSSQDQSGRLLGCGCSSQANARLIAAAPDLLTALENIVEAENVYVPLLTGPGKAAYKQARAAIAKARGQEEELG